MQELSQAFGDQSSVENVNIFSSTEAQVGEGDFSPELEIPPPNHTGPDMAHVYAKVIQMKGPSVLLSPPALHYVEPRRRKPIPIPASSSIDRTPVELCQVKVPVPESDTLPDSTRESESRDSEQPQTFNFTDTSSLEEGSAHLTFF